MHNRRAITLDLREQILEAYDEGEATQDQVVHRFRVSLGMVQLLQQWHHSRDIRARYHLAGRNPLISPEHSPEMDLISQAKPDRGPAEILHELHRQLVCKQAALAGQ